MKALVESIGRVGSRVKLGEHEVVFDQPASVPGGFDSAARKCRRRDSAPGWGGPPGGMTEPSAAD
jgi:hypothetical protein